MLEANQKKQASTRQMVYVPDIDAVVAAAPISYYYRRLLFINAKERQHRLAVIAYLHYIIHERVREKNLFFSSHWCISFATGKWEEYKQKSIKMHF